MRTDLSKEDTYMKKLLLLVATLTFTLGMSAVVMAETPSDIDYSKMHIKWSDEFNGNSLDLNVLLT